jgi:hypothetical protein
MFVADTIYMHTIVTGSPSVTDTILSKLTRDSAGQVTKDDELIGTMQVLLAFQYNSVGKIESYSQNGTLMETFLYNHAGQDSMTINYPTPFIGLSITKVSHVDTPAARIDSTFANASLIEVQTYNTDGTPKQLFSFSGNKIIDRFDYFYDSLGRITERKMYSLPGDTLKMVNDYKYKSQRTAIAANRIINATRFSGSPSRLQCDLLGRRMCSEIKMGFAGVVVSNSRIDHCKIDIQQSR